jgi:hypothetical protein
MHEEPATGDSVADAWTEYWLLPSAEVKNEWSYSSTPPHAFRGVCLTFKDEMQTALFKGPVRTAL